MKGPNMAPDDQGGSGGAHKSDDASPDYTKQWLQDKLITDIQKELGAAGHLPQDLVVFWGYAADSDREGYARLYLNLQFNEYIEFETNAIVLSKDMGGQDRPFSGIVVWLKRDTTIQHVRLEALDMQRNFLQSTLPPFQGGMSGGTGSGAGYGGGGSIICGGGGSIICGGGGSIVCGGGGSIVCGGGGSIVCGGGGSIVCGGGGSMVCGQ